MLTPARRSPYSHAAAVRGLALLYSAERTGQPEVLRRECIEMTRRSPNQIELYLTAAHRRGWIAFRIAPEWAIEGAQGPGPGRKPRAWRLTSEGRSVAHRLFGAPAPDAAQTRAEAAKARALAALQRAPS